MNKPFLLKPSPKDYLWGGERLKSEYGKAIDISPLAETWECSTHPDGPSIAASGEYKGRYLTDILKSHPEFLGTHPLESYPLCARGELPVLIKLIDASKDLSIQVHPTDEFALKNENGSFGKSELWYILDAIPDAKIIFGLSRNTTKEELRQAISEGNIMKHLQESKVKANDVFFVEAGTIHAIGKGVLIAEIQENSNITYRLHDYDRLDKNGAKRPLHIEKALESANLDYSPEPKQPMRVLRYTPGMAYELLGRCKYFQVGRMLLSTQRGQKVTYMSDELSFRSLVCIEGSGKLSFLGETMPVKKGDCFFVPANSPVIEIDGRLQFIDVVC